MSPGRAAALVIGLLAILVCAFLLLAPVKAGGDFAGLGGPVDCGTVFNLNPEIGSLFECRDSQKVRRTGAAVGGVAGIALLIYGLISPDIWRPQDTIDSWARYGGYRTIEETPPLRPRPPTGQADLTTQLKELRHLHDEGALDDDEYKAAKAKLLSEDGA